MISLHKKIIFNLLFISLISFYYKINYYKSTPYLILYNSYSSFDSIFINITEISDFFPDNIKNVLNVFDNTLNRSFNEYISWNPNVYDLFSDDFYVSVNTVNRDAIHSRGTIYSVRNVLVNQGTTFVYNNTYLQVRIWYFPGWFIFYEGNLSFHADRALILGHSFCKSNFGHFIHDYLVPLAYFPDWIIKTSYIICQCIREIALEFLQAFGIEENQIIWLPEDGWVSCNLLYVIDDPSPSLTYFGLPAVRFKEKCDKAFDLNNIKPYRSGLINRKSYTRHIQNMNEILYQCRLKFPDYTWVELKDYYQTINETARTWATMKFAFMPTGSNVAKVFFMHPNTSICVAQADILDDSPMKDAAAIGVFSRWFNVIGMSHRIPINGGWPVNVTFVLENIKYSLYAIKYQKWPSSPNFTL